MRELIIKSLENMKSIEEKAILKDVLNDILIELFNESERKYTSLEQRVRNELPFVYAPYAVYCTVLPRNHIEAKHAYLSSMFPNEIESASLNTKALLQALDDGEEPVISTVFYEADGQDCLNLGRDKGIFDGYLNINSEQYPIRCRLSPAKRYLELVERVYESFLKNNVPWTTVNCSYLYKFFDVRLIDMPKTLPDVDIEPDQISMSFHPHENSIKQGLIPAWNIDKHSVRGDDLPVPALDKLNYEYRFNVKKLGSKNGFLADYDSANILSAWREDDEVIVVSPKKRLAWDLYRFRLQKDTPVDEYLYPVLSNARKDAFSTRMTAAYGVQVNTKAELLKLIRSFDASDYVAPESVYISDVKEPGETYCMNPFIQDEVRNADDQRTLLISFRARERDFFLNRDLMSFLVSQTQCSFHDYNCQGVLL